MTTVYDDHSKRVKKRYLGGEIFEGNNIVRFRGPPTRLPRNGRVIVHNQVAHTVTQFPGAHGFRAWTQIPDGHIVPCRCGWGHIKHYHVRGRQVWIYDGGLWGVIGNKKPKNLRRVQ
jgi:hypothetical protein